MHSAHQHVAPIARNSVSVISQDIPIYNIYRYINAREGFGRKYDWVEAWFTSRMTPAGPLPLMDYYRTRVLSKDDVNKLLDDYYQARGWDIKTGNPR